MNFLAHLWLADRTGTSMAGAILGDVVHGADLSAYPDEVALGIRLHRRVDALTDRHPGLQPLREDFAPGARRYAGIVLDLASDHALTQQWSEIADEPLAAFCARAAIEVARAGEWFDRAGGRAPTAASFAALLQSYATHEGIERAIRRTASRLRRPQPLLDAAAHWPDLALRLQPLMPPLLDELQRAGDELLAR